MFDLFDEIIFLAYDAAYLVLINSSQSAHPYSTDGRCPICICPNEVGQMQLGEFIIDGAVLWTVLLMLGLLVFGLIVFVIELIRGG